MSASGIFVLPSDSREMSARRVLTYLIAAMPGKKLKVEVTEAKPPRSDCQNRALWGCAYKALRDQTGNDPDDLHSYFCGEYFGWQEYEVMGATRKRPIRTTTKDADGKRDVIGKIHMADFYGFIQMRSAENGFDVPDPDPMWFEEAA